MRMPLNGRPIVVPFHMLTGNAFGPIDGCGPWADPGGGPDPPEKTQNIGFLSNSGPDALKSQSYRASIQCWTIINTPFKWRFASGPMMAHL